MPVPAIAIAGAGLASAAIQANAAKKAGAQQAAAAQSGIDEQRRQFDLVRKLLDPYVTAGGQGLQAQLGLMGLNGPEAQRTAIQSIQSGSEFRTMVQEGDNAILQNASATGGLRGGNTQGALAQFRPQVLNSLINQQLQRFGGLATMGQSSAVGVGNAGQNMANNVSGLMQQQGAALAGASLARGQAFGNFLGGIGGLIGQGGFGGGINIGKSGSLFGGNSWGF